MSNTSLFRDPRYADLVSTARAMLKQRMSSGGHVLDEEKLSRLASIMRSVRSDPEGSADTPVASVDSLPPGLES